MYDSTFFNRSTQRGTIPAIHKAVCEVVEEMIWEEINSDERSKDMPEEKKQLIFNKSWEKCGKSGFFKEMEDESCQGKMRAEREKAEKEREGKHAGIDNRQS